MDHQIQHHGDVIGPIGVGTVATRLKNHHLLVGHHLGELTEGRIEPLDVAHLQQTPRRRSGLNQCGGFVLTSRNRLFDQNVHARTQAGQTDGMVQQRRNRDADGLHLRKHGVVVGEPAAAELLGSELAALSIRIRDSNQIGISQKTEHPSVMPTHVADADHPDLDLGPWGRETSAQAVDWGKTIGLQSDSSSELGRTSRTRSIRGPAMAVISN